MAARKTLRELVNGDHIIISPAAHDAISARLIAHMGFEAISISGSAMLAARYGLPDLGIAALAEMAAGARDIIEAVDVPCSTDGDDGYGGVKNVVQTVRVYESIGVGAVTFEDQSRSDKQPGQMGVKGVVSEEEILQKLSAALDTRDSRDMMIIGRTDLLGLEGLDAAMARADKFLSVGADGVFISGMRKPEEFETVGRRFKGTYIPAVLSPINKNIQFTPDELYRMGYKRIVFPSLLLNEAIDAMSGMLADMCNRAGMPVPPRPTMESAVELDRWLKIDEKY